MTEKAQDVDFSVDESRNAIILSMSDITAYYKAKDFVYKHNRFIKARGSVDVVMSGVKIGAVI